LREVFRFDDFVLDVLKKELTRGSDPVQLVGKPLELLIYLVRNRERLVKKREIYEQVWRGDWDRSVNNTIDQAIRELRAALQDDARSPIFVKSVRGEGVRFVAPTTVEQECAPNLLPV